MISFPFPLFFILYLLRCGGNDVESSSIHRFAAFIVLVCFGGSFFNFPVGTLVVSLSRGTRER